jgi:hypothetical protein
MRSGDVGWPVSEDGSDGSWKLGRPVELAWPKRGWGTPFSGFRFAVPEFMGFEGRAVYMDADMLVLGDVAELLERPMSAGITCCHFSRTDVSVIDCAWFKDKSWWPRISEMKASGWRVFEYLRLLQPRNAISATLPWEWNDCEGQIWTRSGKSRLIHYTSVPHQPYRPYESVRYSDVWPYHPNLQVGELWWNSYQDALHAMHGPVNGQRIFLDRAKARP